jgi:hypothetical protein
MCAAHNRQTLTYSMLGDTVGLPQWGLAKSLDHIQAWCHRNDLPPLTVLVVKSSEGIPSSGFHAAGDLDLAREKVFAHNWFGMHPITPDTLRKLYE